MILCNVALSAVEQFPCGAVCRYTFHWVVLEKTPAVWHRWAFLWVLRKQSLCRAFLDRAAQLTDHLRFSAMYSLISISSPVLNNSWPTVQQTSQYSLQGHYYAHGDIQYIIPESSLSLSPSLKQTNNENAHTNHTSKNVNAHTAKHLKQWSQWWVEFICNIKYILDAISNCL